MQSVLSITWWWVYAENNKNASKYNHVCNYKYEFQCLLINDTHYHNYLRQSQQKKMFNQSSKYIWNRILMGWQFDTQNIINITRANKHKSKCQAWGFICILVVYSEPYQNYPQFTSWINQATTTTIYNKRRFIVNL